MKVLAMTPIIAVIIVLAGVLCDMMQPPMTNASLTRAKALLLTEAVETYKHNNGSYPTTLDALALPQPNGDPPIVQADSLVDLWGEPFDYNPAGPNHVGVKPDIWASRPDGPIGNWPDARWPTIRIATGREMTR
jgi:hypothetical protein